MTRQSLINRTDDVREVVREVAFSALSNTLIPKNVTHASADKIANRLSRVYLMGWYDNHPTEIILANITKAFTESIFNSVRTHNANTGERND